MPTPLEQAFIDAEIALQAAAVAREDTSALKTAYDAAEAAWTAEMLARTPAENPGPPTYQVHVITAQPPNPVIPPFVQPDNYPIVE